MLLKTRNNLNIYSTQDQTLITIIIKKYKNLSTGLFNLPLFTVGIPSEKVVRKLCLVHPIHCDKEYSLKERLLYYLDDNKYYTSLENHYIKVARSFLNKYMARIIYLCKVHNLIIILPDQTCNRNNCLYELKPKFGDKLFVKYLKTNNISYRESISF